METEVFSNLSAARRHAEMESRINGKDHLVLEVIVGGIAVLAVFSFGYFIGWVFMGEDTSGLGKGLPNPTPKLNDIRVKIEEQGLLQGDDKILERDVMEHAISFCQDEEIPKVLDAVASANEDLKFPRKFFSSAKSALAFLTNEDPKKGLGVTVAEKEFRVAWEKGLPKKKDKKDEKKDDASSVADVLKKGFEDLKGLFRKKDDGDKGDQDEKAA